MKLPNSRLWVSVFVGSLTLAVIIPGTTLIGLSGYNLYKHQLTAFSSKSGRIPTLPKNTSPTNNPAVLAAEDDTNTPQINFNGVALFNEKTYFNKDIDAQGIQLNLGSGSITASNIIYSLNAGTGIKVTGGQNPTISATTQNFTAGNGISLGAGANPALTNTGVLSLAGKTGALDLEAGDGITIDGLKVTNKDKGSDQSIFKNIAISGQSTLSAGSNSDTVNLAAGTGITLSTDTTTKTVTITGATAADSGWSTGVGTIYTTDTSANVGIGNSAPTTKLDVTGAIKSSSDLTVGGNFILNSDTISDLTGNGLTLSANALSLLLTSSGTSGATSSNSGLEVSNAGLTLLKGCSTGDVMKWNESNSMWECASDAGASGTGIVIVQENDVDVSNQAATLDFLGSDFVLNESPSGEVNIALDYPNSHITRSNQAETITNSWAFSNGLSVSSGLNNNTGGINNAGTIAGATGITSSGAITFSVFTTNGGLLYTNGSGVLSQTPAGTATTVLHGGATPSYSAVSLTSDISGVLPIANGGTNKNLTLSAGGLPYFDADSFEVLSAGVSGQFLTSGGSSAPSWTNIASALTAGTNISLSGTTNATISVANAPNFSGTVTANALSVGSNTFTVNSSGALTAATGLTSSGTITLSGLSDGLLKSTSGVLSGGNSVNLGSEVTGTLPLGNGGTGFSTYTKGDLIYANNTNSLAKLGIGSSNQVLTVSGAGVPSWTTISGGTGGLCTDCIINDPGATQTITPTASNATALSIAQASSGSVDIFNVTNNAGSTKYLQIDSSGNVSASSLSGTGTRLATATSAGQVGSLANGSEGQVLSLSGGALTWATLGSSSITPDSLDFTEFKDSMSLDANLTLAQTTNTWAQTYTGTTGTGYTYTASSLTSGSAANFTTAATAFTGNLVNITSTGNNANNTGSLFRVGTSGTSDAVTTAMITNLGTGYSFKVNDETGDNDSSPFLIDSAGNVAVGVNTDGAYKMRVIASGDTNVQIASGTTNGAARLILGDGTDRWYLQNSIADEFNIYDAANNQFRLTINSSGNVGIGETSPNSLLSVGSGNLFQVNSSGAIASATGITSSGTITFSGLNSAGLVTNTSGGVLGTTSTLGASYITADSLDYTEFKDTMALDADLILNQSSNTWTQNYTGTTGTGFTYTANSLTSGKAFAISSSGSSFTSNGELVDLNLSTNNNTAGSKRGLNLVVSNTGNVTSGTDTIYGQYTDVTRTGATDGTFNTYGQFTSVTGDVAGNSSLYGAYTGVTGGDNAFGVYALATTPSRDSTNFNYYNGITSQVSHSGSGTISSAIAADNYIDITDGGSIDSAYGGTFGIRNAAGGTITNGYGLYITSATNTGTFTNNYGLYISDQSAVGSTNSYNIYSVGGTAKNYFAGLIGVGDATPDHKLDVDGNIGLTAGNYLNWGDTDGTGGYGVRDNAGTLEFKNSGGAWAAFGTPGYTGWTVDDSTTSQAISSGNTLTIADSTTIDGVVTATDTLTYSVKADSLDFTEFKDSLTLDASTDITITGSNVFSITNTGSGNSFVINDQAADTTPFVVDPSGKVGIGTTAPDAALEINSATGNNLRITYNDADGSATNYTSLLQGSDQTFNIQGVTGSAKISSTGANTEKTLYIGDYDDNGGGNYLRVANNNSLTLNNFKDNSSGSDYNLGLRSYGSTEIHIDLNNDETDRTFKIIANNILDLLTVTETGALTAAGAITAPTSTNTINGLVINSGALSSSTGYAQSSGTFTVNGSGAVSLGTGTNGVVIGNTTGGNTINGATSFGNRVNFSHGNSQGLKLPTNAGAPSSVTGTAEGDIVWDSTNDALYIYNGTAFTQVGSYTFTNGLTNSSGTVSLGGALTGATTITNGTASDFSVDLTSTGDFLIKDSGTAIASYLDTGAITFAPTSGQNFTVTAAGAGGLSFTTATGSQTFSSSVVSGTTTTSGFVYNANSITSGTGTYITSSSITTGKLMQLITSGNTWSSGNILDISSTSTALTSGKLIALDWSPGSSTTATGDLFSINIGSNGNVGNLLNITDSSSSVFSVSETAVTAAVPVNFTAAGDVSMAYDLLFTNQTSSNIKSNGPLTIESGESFESNDLVLKTYNSGKTVIQNGLSFGSQTTLTANSTTPSVSGGSYFITANSSGTLISNFTGGSTGQIIFVEINDANTDFDCNPGTNINCGSTDITIPAAGDMFTWIYNGTKWVLIGWMDASADHSAGADLAELYVNNENLEPGTIVAAKGADNPLEVTAATRDTQQKILGAISTEPHTVMGGNDTEGFQIKPVALAGRVPLKVTTENGAIKPGDFITISSKAGIGMKASEPGMVIGKALSAYDNQDKEAIGTITLFIQNTYYSPITSVLAGATDLTPDALSSTAVPHLLVSGAAEISDLTVTGTFLAGNLSITGMSQAGGADLSTLTGPLRIQQDADNNVEIMGGKVIIDTSGNIIADEGTLSAKTISAEKVNIKTGDVAGASIGTSTIPATQTSVTINSTAVTANSHIFVTAKTKTKQPLAVTSSEEGNSFTVEIDHSQNEDVIFSWWIIN